MMNSASNLFINSYNDEMTANVKDNTSATVTNGLVKHFETDIDYLAMLTKTRKNYQTN